MLLDSRTSRLLTALLLAGAALVAEQVQRPAGPAMAQAVWPAGAGPAASLQRVAQGTCLL